MSRRMILLILLAVLAFALDQAFRADEERKRIASLPTSTSLQGAFTPREGIQAATRIAEQWDPECFLQCVRIAFYGELENNLALTLEGMPIPPCGWMYRYFSPKHKRFLNLSLTPDGHCQAAGASALNYLDSQPLPDEFLDSPTVFQIAENAYGKEFREKVRLFRITAQVTTWPSTVGGPTDPVHHRPTWQIHYLGTRQDSPASPIREDLYLLIDAVTGEVLTAIKYEDSKVRIIFNAFEEK